MWREPKPRRALTSTGNATSAGSSSGSQVGGERDPALVEEAVRERTCPRRAGSSPARAAARARRARRARCGEQQVVEVGERDDEPDVVLLDERRAARRGSRGRRPRHDRVPVGGVERRRELVRVDRERRRAGAAEGGDDVDPLSRAGEEDDGHVAERSAGRHLDSAACVARPAADGDRHRRNGPGRLLPRAPAARRAAGRCTRPCATPPRRRRSSAAHERLRACGATCTTRARSARSSATVRPEELYNLAGESSVGASFADPRATWDSNAHIVVHLLDAIRTRQPRHALLPGVVRRDVRLGARRERRPRRVVGPQPAEPVRGREGRRAPALPQLPRVVRPPDRLRDPLQPRVAPARPRSS